LHREREGQSDRADRDETECAPARHATHDSTTATASAMEPASRPVGYGTLKGTTRRGEAILSTYAEAPDWGDYGTQDLFAFRKR
jgi:hypothetical protein